MNRELKMGDRVRVTPRSRVKGYQPGDKGVVLEGPTVYTGASDASYVVAMDKDGPGSTSTVFSADDIEPDATAAPEPGLPATGTGRRHSLHPPQQEEPMPLSDPILKLAFERTTTDPFFAGYRLAQLREEQSVTLDQQARALGMTPDSLLGLCLCRQPRDKADVEMIAARLGWEAGRVADLLGLRLTT